MSISLEHQAEVAQSREHSVKTLRATVPALEDILYHPFLLLDHGFIRVIDYMGNDASIVQAARVSYGRGTKQISQDKGLIDYLMRHRHTTPFEMCELKIHAKMPIFVARQWIRHRTANVNEYSGRYSIMGKDFYLPSPDTLAPQAVRNRQGREGSLSPEEADRVLEILQEDASHVYKRYEELMNCSEDGTILDSNRQGLARELARMNLTLNYYTEWYWKIDLLNLLHFISLRADPHAEYEIRVYAEALCEIVTKWVPLTADAFNRYQKEGGCFSREGLAALKKMIQGEKVSQATSGMSPGEWREFSESLALQE